MSRLSEEREAEIREAYSGLGSYDIEDLLAELDALRADLARVTDRLATIVDEAFSMQPVMGAEELLTFLERKLFDNRQEFNRVTAERDTLLQQLAELDSQWHDAAVERDDARGQLEAGYAMMNRTKAWGVRLRAERDALLQAAERQATYFSACGDLREAIRNARAAERNGESP